MRIPAPVQRLAFAAARRLPPGVVRAVNLARGIDAPRPVDLPPGRRVAVVAPHPDDELVGAGGTLAKHVAAGHAVRVVMVTSGEASASFAGRDPGEARSQRETEASRALAEVGLNGDDLVFLRIPERSLADAGAGDLVGALGAFGPDLVYCPSPGDGHAGHAAVARMVAAALPQVDSVAHVALYEVMTPIYPSVVVDVTAQMAAKRAGLGHYASALASFDIVRIAEGLSAYRSVHAQHGRGYAEAFSLLRPAELGDLVTRAG